jgi:hypothetical protein
MRSTGAVHGHGGMHEWAHLPSRQTLRLQLGVDLPHSLGVWTRVRPPDPIPLGVTGKTIVVAPLMRYGDQPVRWADIYSVLRQQPQKLGIRRVGVGDGCREQYRCREQYGGKDRTERIDTHG